MPAYNAERYIEQAIESVLGQTMPDWELVVVDDGSTDATAQRAAALAERDPRIKLVRQANGGESTARNTALRHMQGELVAFLDADDFYLPNHLALTVGYLQTHPDRDGVYTDGYHCDEQGVRLKTLSSRRRGPFEGWLFEELVIASDVFGPPLCLVLRRGSIVERDLAFDPDIVIGPDWEFTIRYAHDAQFGYIDQITCQYRVHRANITTSTGIDRRMLSLATCREKAIRLPKFAACSLETRRATFYELLVHLLIGLPERQSAIVNWPQFKALPTGLQAELLRLMASKAIARNLRHGEIDSWLRQANALDPSDKRAAALARLYGLNPWLCHLVVRARKVGQVDLMQRSPLSDVMAAGPGRAA
jgi:alpha-1,6-rhamnosyltransferase